MKIIYNNIIPFKGFLAINLFGVLFVRGTYRDLSATVLNHEKIHTAQMKELWYIPFYVIYLLEWVARLFMPGHDCSLFCCVREAYDDEGNMSYLANRKRYAMWRK